MKYAGRIFAAFLILFMVSELAYSVSSDVFAREKEERGLLDSYYEGLDLTGSRLKGSARLIWKAQGLEASVEEWMALSPAEFAGLNREEFTALLEERQLPEEMVRLGLTGFRVESFAGYEAVISVIPENSNDRRFGYWCRVQDGKVTVTDAERSRLVLEQALVRSRFTAEELRRLEQGWFLETYEDVIRLLEAPADLPGLSSCREPECA